MILFNYMKQKFYELQRTQDYEKCLQVVIIENESVDKNVGNGESASYYKQLVELSKDSKIKCSIRPVICY